MEREHFGSIYSGKMTDLVVFTEVRQLRGNWLWLKPGEQRSKCSLEGWQASMQFVSSPKGVLEKIDSRKA